MIGAAAGARARLLVAGAALAFVVVAALAGSLMALLGASLPCVGGGGGSASFAAGPADRAVHRDFSPARIALFQAAGRRFDIDWTFVASIAYQECGAGVGCVGANPSGCAGPMEIAAVRESACSPGPGPTLWERYGLDIDGDGVANVNDPVDAIFSAAHIMRVVMHAPPAGGSYGGYRQAACNYYGACADSIVAYADEVMSRAVEFGFRGEGAQPRGAGGEVMVGSDSGSSCGGGAVLPSGAGPMGPVRKVFAPRQLALLPTSITAGAGIECDARIIADVVYLARRFGLLITACYGTGHEPDGEHPLGAAIDSVPRDGNWARTLRAAEAAGWKASCAASGVAPECARPPFRFIGYNGYPGHGDPSHCACGGNAHLHISWLTSASPGQAENAFHYSYSPAKWIETFAVPGAGAADPEPSPGHRRARYRRASEGGGGA